MRRGALGVELAQARGRLAALASQVAQSRDEVAEARAVAAQAVADVQWLAGWVVAVMDRTGWRGYSGQLREVVERYVPTGH
ncbi:hypothetical protein GCM10010401_08490 [Rarobacter faecitabidus]